MQLKAGYILESVRDALNAYAKRYEVACIAWLVKVAKAHLKCKPDLILKHRLILHQYLL